MQVLGGVLSFCHWMLFDYRMAAEELALQGISVSHTNLLIRAIRDNPRFRQHPYKTLHILLKSNLEYTAKIC